MKVKNVKVGTRVQLKRDVVMSFGTLEAGMTGTLKNSHTDVPVVTWDTPVTFSYVFDDSSNSWAVCADDLRKIKG